jgi:hypothetical protein
LSKGIEMSEKLFGGTVGTLIQKSWSKRGLTLIFWMTLSLPLYPAEEKTKTVNVKFFFPVDGTQNPDGISGIPNWYYYWKQTSADFGIHQFNGPSCQPGWFGYYSHLVIAPNFIVCPSARGNCGKVGRFPNQPEAIGIDCFAVTALHEGSHMEHYQSWWSGGKSGNRITSMSMGGFQQCVSFRQANPNNQLVDCDEDDVPDSLEPGLGLDPNRKLSTGLAGDPCLSNHIDDEHCLAYLAELNWTLGAGNSQDWSEGGKQW